jgi:hypothetical protein
MKRCLFNLVTAVSLLLCVAVCVLWVRSYWVFSRVSHRVPYAGGPADPSHGGWDSTDVVLHRGRFYVERASVRSRFASVQPRARWEGFENHTRQPYVDFEPGYWHWTVAGFAVIHLDGSDGTGIEVTRVAFPAWALAAPSAALPAIAAARRVRRRFRKGCCRNCGYDLRATPERCPECGTIATAPS